MRAIDFGKHSKKKQKNSNPNSKHGSRNGSKANSRRESVMNEAENPDLPPDLIIVAGTSLQVAPVCAIPNMVPKDCVRVLVNQPVAICFKNNWSPPKLNRYKKKDTMRKSDFSEIDLRQKSRWSS